MNKSKEPEVTIFFDRAMENLSKPEKERLRYVRIRWEALRRNDDFLADYYDLCSEVDFQKDFFEQSSSAQEKEYEFVEKWWILSPLELDPFLTLEAHALQYAYYAKGENSSADDETLFSDALFKVAAIIDRLTEHCIYLRHKHDKGVVTYPFIHGIPPSVQSEVKRNGTVEVLIKLEYSEEKLVNNFRSLIKKLHSLTEKNVVATKPIIRKKHYWSLYAKYFEVYDMRKKAGFTFREIAEKIIPSDCETDIKAAQEKIRQYNKEAERLIENAFYF